MSSKISAMRYLYAFSVGTAAGATVGIVGWGGGQIIIPGLTYPHSIANIPQLSATGVSLSCLSLSSISSGGKFWREHKVNLPIAISICVPAVLSSFVGSHIAKKLSGNVLALIFNGYCVASIPVFFWIQKRRSTKHYDDGDTIVGITLSKEQQMNGPEISHKLLDDIMSTPNLPQHIVCGIASGLIGSMIGVGGLPLTMSYLSEYTHLSHHLVQGTSVIALTPSIIFSAVTKLNVMPFQITVLAAFGSIVGGYGGAKFALSLTEEQLRFLYMGSLVLFGGRSMVGAIGNIRTIWFTKK